MKRWPVRRSCFCRRGRGRTLRSRGSMPVGGDFYDVLTLPDGGLLLFIGDVAGHGLESAIVMGSMRAALRAYVLSHGAPNLVLADMNAFALTHQRAPMVTCQCVVIDA